MERGPNHLGRDRSASDVDLDHVPLWGRGREESESDATLEHGRVVPTRDLAGDLPIQAHRIARAGRSAPGREQAPQ